MIQFQVVIIFQEISNTCDDNRLWTRNSHVTSLHLEKFPNNETPQGAYLD